MRRRRYITWFGLLVLAIVLFMGFVEVIEKRFAEGGVYPHYASFRSDPLGTSALYESLSGIPGVQVERNVKHLNSLEGLDSDTVLLLLGLPREGLNNLRAPSDSEVVKAIKSGARLVVTINPGLVPEKFLPSTTEEEDDWLERRRELQEERIRSERQGDSEEADETEDDALDEEELLEEEMDLALGERFTGILGVSLESLEEFERPDGGWDLTPGEDGPVKVLPSWYSQFRFETEDPAWKAIAEAEGGPVVIERQFGKGSIVFASDSFFVSNEALHLEPIAPFLAWIIGDKTKLIFDETIHGSQETGGAMKLMRRYRVHGVFFGILVFVVLWAWRSSSPLAPAEEGMDRGIIGSGGTISGEEMGKGLTRLLRQSIQRSQLVPECFRIWKESQHRAVPAKAEREVSELLGQYELSGKNRDLVSLYHRIAECLRRH